MYYAVISVLQFNIFIINRDCYYSEKIGRWSVIRIVCFKRFLNLQNYRYIHFNVIECLGDINDSNFKIDGLSLFSNVTRKQHGEKNP